MRIYDEINRNRFKDGEKTFLCCNCGNIADYEQSISNKGSHLICMACVYKIADILNCGFNDIVEGVHKSK